MPTTREIFEVMQTGFVPEAAQGLNVTIQFDLTGPNAAQHHFVIANGMCTLGDGLAVNPTMTLSATTEDFIAIAKGELPGMNAFMQGRLRVSGDMALAMRFQGMFRRPQ